MTALSVISDLDDGLTVSPAALAALASAEQQASVSHYRRELLLDRYAADVCFCGTAGQGPVCDGCTNDHDRAMQRAEDL